MKAKSICRGVLILALSLSLFACSYKQTPAGFLGDQENYAAMQKDSQLGGKVWRAPQFKPADYNKFIIPRIRIWLSTEGEKQNIAPAELNRLAFSFRNKIIAKISDRYPIVQTPSADTLILNIAITEAAPATSSSSLGGAAIEVEFLDSITGERLVAFMDREVEKTAGQERWSATQSAFDAWANLIRQRLDESHS